LRLIFGFIEDVEVMLVIPLAQLLFDQFLFLGVRQMS
jgi:hypothetical protein